MKKAHEHHKHSAARTGKKVQQIAAKLVNKHTQLILKHMSGRHIFSKPRAGLKYDDEHEAASLISLVPTNFDKACKVSKRLIKKKGNARHKALTGISKLHCRRTAAQRKAEARGEYIMPMSKKKYDTMASFIEARTKKESDAALQADIDKAMIESKAEAKAEVTKHMQDEVALADEKLQEEGKAWHEAALKANDEGADTCAGLMGDLEHMMADDIKQLDKEEAETVQKERRDPSYKGEDHMEEEHVEEDINNLGKRVIFEDLDKMQENVDAEELKEAEEELARVKREGPERDIPELKQLVRKAKARLNAAEKNVTAEESWVEGQKAAMFTEAHHQNSTSAVNAEAAAATMYFC